MYLSLGSSVPSGLLSQTDFKSSNYNTSRIIPMNPSYLTTIDVIFQAQVVTVEPTFWGSNSYYYYVQPQTVESYYGDLPSSGPIFMFNFYLDPSAKNTTLPPITVFAILSELGQVIAAVAIANIFIRWINFYWFYLVATDAHFVPDANTRKFLLARKKVRVKEFENMLLYAFTFGGSDRFGVQSRQLYEFFNDRSKRYDRVQTQAIVEDVQKFLTSRRISKFVHEEEKVNRAVETNYDIRLVGGKWARVAEQMKRAQQGNKLALDEDDAKDRENVIREVETTLKLCALQDELSKLKVICALIFPPQAKAAQLAEKLAGKIS